VRTARFKRVAAWLAFAALALQIALSFGHVHIDGVHGTYRPADLTGTITLAKQLPAPQPGGDDDDYCAICATIYLTATSLTPQAPQLPARFAVQRVEHFDRVAFAFVATRRTAFQARAPPLA
jgi:hypothetical protein